MSLLPITLAAGDCPEFQVLAQAFWHGVALFCLSEHPKHMLSVQQNHLLPVQVLVCRVFRVPKVFQEKKVL